MWERSEFIYVFAKGSVESGGLDYSESLIKCAAEITRSKDLKCSGADELPEQPKYDLVMAESVFQYFESTEYAEDVLNKMLQKAEKIVYLGEMHDKEYETELMEYRRKTIPNYDENYKGLHKLFYSKQWIEDIAKKYEKKVVYSYVDNTEYINGKYLFNCYVF